MRSTLRSLWIWSATSCLIVLWLPLLTLVRLSDSDPVHYRTGRWFRRLGAAMCRVNPAWRVHLSGHHPVDPRLPYVVVSNHQSLADIPILSNLPWEMKWVAKKELFRVPFAGWMMRLAGDIPVDRRDPRSGARSMLTALDTLKHRCCVMIFPEGTRSPDGRIGPFADGAFSIALKAQVPILPIAVTGSQTCLPKKSWKFGNATDIFVDVLPAVSTAGYTRHDTDHLRDRVRAMIVEQVARRRGVHPASIDANLPSFPPEK